MAGHARRSVRGAWGHIRTSVSKAVLMVLPPGGHRAVLTGLNYIPRATPAHIVHAALDPVQMGGFKL